MEKLTQNIKLESQGYENNKTRTRNFNVAYYEIDAIFYISLSDILIGTVRSTLKTTILFTALEMIENNASYTNVLDRFMAKNQDSRIRDFCDKWTIIQYDCYKYCFNAALQSRVALNMELSNIKQTLKNINNKYNIRYLDHSVESAITDVYSPLFRDYKYIKSNSYTYFSSKLIKIFYKYLHPVLCNVEDVKLSGTEFLGQLEYILLHRFCRSTQSIPGVKENLSPSDLFFNDSGYKTTLIGDKKGKYRSSRLSRNFRLAKANWNDLSKKKIKYLYVKKEENHGVEVHIKGLVEKSNKGENIDENSNSSYLRDEEDKHKTIDKEDINRLSEKYEEHKVSKKEQDMHQLDPDSYDGYSIFSYVSSSQSHKSTLQ